MDEGWIKIHRRLMDHPLWKGEKFTKGQAWVDILLRVNHEENEVVIGNQIVVVKPGQTLWSMLKMADRWGWSRKRVNNFLNGLQKRKMVTTERTTKYTIVTVVNWDVHQIEEQQKVQHKEHQRNIKGTSKEHQKNINKNDKNDKNDKNKKNKADFKNELDNLFVEEQVSRELKEAVVEFVEHRKAIKSPMTALAVKRLLSKLHKMTTDEQKKD